MTAAFMDTPARLRQALEKRREKSTTTNLLRTAFTLDQSLSDRVEEVAHMREAAERRLDYLQELNHERDPDDPAQDIRATGEDVSELGQQLAEAEAELERLNGELEAAVKAAQESVVTLVFRRADAEEYEALLIESGGALVDTDVKAAQAFQNALTARCFVRVEVDGEDGGFRTWQEFREAAALSFGELDPIRAMVFLHNKRSGNSVPFSSTPSRRTTSS